MSSNFAHAIWRWYATTLLHPPPASWVARVASTFYALALMILLPMAFITGLDIASWLIMRTMGTISADLPPATIVRNVAADAHDAEQKEHAPAATRRHSGALGLTLSITPADEHESFYGVGSSSGGTSPSEHLHSNTALAGDGIFSPIVSRAASPELVRRSRKGSLAGSSSTSSSFVDLGALTPATGANTGTGSLRKRAAVH